MQLKTANLSKPLNLHEHESELSNSVVKPNPDMLYRQTLHRACLGWCQPRDGRSTEGSNSFVGVYGVLWFSLQSGFMPETLYTSPNSPCPKP